MIIVEKNKVIIEVNCGEDYEHAFVYSLHNDLIELMNWLHVMQAVHELDPPFQTSFTAIKLLQKAFIPYEEIAEQLYPFKTTNKRQN